MGNGGGTKTYPSVKDTPYKDTPSPAASAAAQSANDQKALTADEAQAQGKIKSESVVHAPGAALPTPKPQRAMASSIGSNMTGSSVVTG